MTDMQRKEYACYSVLYQELKVAHTGMWLLDY